MALHTVGGQSVERKLAAILCADVVGYSRLMGEDEEGTLARLKAHRSELIDPTVAAHHGRIIKLMGDGVLVEFASVVDAVHCARQSSVQWLSVTATFLCGNALNSASV